jgi:hypothetical protein
MGLIATFYDPPTPFYGGLVSPSPITVLGRLVSIGEHWYEVDLKSDRYRLASVPALRPQADTSDTPGEQTLTVEGLWRRILQSWEHGAGQDWYDRAGRDRLRFRASRGIDPWTEGELSLLDTTTSIETEASGWNGLAVGEFTAGQRLVAVGNNGKAITVDLADAETTITGLTGALQVASNGSAVYIAASDGIYLVNVGGTGGAMFNTNVNGASRIAFAKNRLIATVGAQLWDVIDGTTATQHYTNPWAGWTWTGIAEGLDVIFACGYAGDRGLIFAIPLKEDGTGLDAPRVAAELPHGELPYALTSYVGFLVVATSKGIRLAEQGDNGQIILGALVSEAVSRCLEPQEEFCWFGWDSMFPDASGLGRLDLSRFVDPLAPAYATDLAASTTGVVNAAITFNDRRFFTAGTGLFRQNLGTKLATGYLETGMITFNLADDKVAVFADVRHGELEADDTVDLYLRSLEGEFELIGSSATPNTTRPSEPWAANHTRSGGHELKVVLNNGGSGDGPIVQYLLLASQPSPSRSFVSVLPLLIGSRIQVNGIDYNFDTLAEVIYLEGLVASQQLIRFRHGGRTRLAFVEDYEFVPYGSSGPEETFQSGTMVVRLKSAELAR